ncbi:YidB family protein [Streptomyces sp. NPDC058274]|uniref:YidB family protein n=1 Tax=Streptomyces sp. NPDC058274 TaxID=3346416 RepID=UPI0036E4FB98
MTDPRPVSKGVTMAGNDLGSLLGGLLGGGGQGGASGGGNVLGALLQSLGGGGTVGNGSNPLGGLLDMLAKSGLADQAQSWVGTGENKPVTGEQVQQALPDGTLQKVADQAGVTPEQAADHLAQSLPQAVDKLTPEGRIPTGSLADLVKEQQL